MTLRKRILVAPLNWGLGHATRCIPIIKALEEQGFEPILASDGVAFSLLKKEFPHLEAIELPSYNIMYSKKGKFFKWNLLKRVPRILKSINRENKALQTIVQSSAIDGVISDNRLGIYSKKVHSIYITHQLQVLSGTTTGLSTKWHQNFIRKFDECWVPDCEGEPNLSGNLGHVKQFEIPTKYIGPLTRFKKVDTKIKYDIMILLSGPEPQRTMLEEKLLNEFNGYNGKVLFVKGKLEDKQIRTEKGNMDIYNFMTSEVLEKSINQSNLIVSRSGYTTIMDLAKLNKKAFFIPTPGQFEQEYLAKRFTKMGIIPSCSQDDFSIEKLKSIDNFEGLTSFECDINYEELFSLF